MFKKFLKIKILCIVFFSSQLLAEYYEGQFSVPLTKKISEYSSEEQNQFHEIHKQVKSILEKAYNEISQLLDEQDDFLNSIRSEDDEQIVVDFIIRK